MREPYSANVIGPIKLLDEIIRLKLGDTARYQHARHKAWSWLMKYPMRNHNWQGYFEDIPIHKNPSENPNQYSALETIKYLIANPALDHNWRTHARDQLAWVSREFGADYSGRFGVEAGIQFGAEVISEQRDDMAKMASHTARFAATLALYSEATGDVLTRERAHRSLNWATYACSETGVVKVGTNDDEGYWFSDGYGDYMRHFLNAMGAVPQWAPHQNHLLRSTTTVRMIDYETPGSIRYETFDAWATDVFRLTARPLAIWAGATPLTSRSDLRLEGYTVAPLASGGWVVRIRHEQSNELTIKF